jgi:hypothetical protein
MAQRKKLPSKSFALPGKGEGAHGKGAGSYPIPDKSHGRNALSRVSAHGTPEEKRIVRAKVHAKFPDIGKKQMGGMIPRSAAPRPFSVPKAPTFGGGVPRPPRAARPPSAFKPVAGRLSAAAGMKSGGVASFPKPHTYHGGGVVKGHSGDPSPATCGSMKDRSGGVGPFK